MAFVGLPPGLAGGGIRVRSISLPKGRIMGMAQTLRFCPTCRRRTLWARPATNHVLHLLLTVLICGFWLPIWVLSSVKIGGWRCQTCGHSGSLVSRLAAPLACVVLFLLAVFLIASNWPPQTRTVAQNASYPPGPSDQTNTQSASRVLAPARSSDAEIKAERKPSADANHEVSAKADVEPWRRSEPQKKTSPAAGDGSQSEA